jgi:transposase
MTKMIEFFAPELAGVPPKKAKDAIRRRGKLCIYYRLLGQSGYRYHSYGGKRLREEAAGKVSVAIATVQRWERLFRSNGIQGLVDWRGGDPKRGSRI